MEQPSTSESTTSFPGVTGHAAVTGMLSRAITRARLHHGLVLTGPRGIGKATLARGLACALMCKVEPARGCGSCDACRRLLAGNHTDLRRLEGEGKSNTIKAATARAIALSAQHAPYEAPAHVIIIDPADRMQGAAAAALLKSIEEPNPGVHWILLATNKSDVLDTILSRCMTIPLERLSLASTRAVVEAELARRPSTDPSKDAERRELAITLSDGSPGVALELLRDPSLEPTRALLAAILEGISHGPAAVFSGDRSPLWAAWKAAVAASPDPDAPDPGEAEEPERVVVVKGKKPKKKRAKKKAKKKSGSKETPARQRATARRLAELWLLHLRERLLGREGLRGMPALAATVNVSQQMQAIQQFQTNLARNPNVRLSLEQLLLSLGR